MNRELSPIEPLLGPVAGQGAVPLSGHGPHWEQEAGEGQAGVSGDSEGLLPHGALLPLRPCVEQGSATWAQGSHLQMAKLEGPKVS